MELPRRDPPPSLAKKALSLMTRSPRLVLVREPDQLGVERAHPQLAFGVRLVELAETNRPAPADDARPPATLDDDHLHAACVARRRDESEPGKQLELAVDRHVPHAGRLDPLANRVVVFAARVVELPTLDVDRPAGEEVVAAAVVEVQVCVDDDVDAGEIEVLLAQWPEAGIEVGHRRVQLRYAGVDQHARSGMVDDVHVDRHPRAAAQSGSTSGIHGSTLPPASRAAPGRRSPAAPARARPGRAPAIRRPPSARRAPATALVRPARPRSARRPTRWRTP